MTESLPIEEFDKLYEQALGGFDAVRARAYSKIMNIPNVDQGKARSYMQKAYVTYASKPSETRPNWPDLVYKLAQEHG